MKKLTENDKKRAYEDVIKTFKKLKCSELIEGLKIEWNSRFTWRMGDALLIHPSLNFLFDKKLVQISPKSRIRFSAVLWPRASKKEKKQTAVHEACHIVDDYLGKTEKNYKKDGVHHGESWKKLMKKCGAEVRRCHNVVPPSRLTKKKTTRKKRK